MTRILSISQSSSTLMPRLLRRDIRHDPSRPIRERISQEFIHCARIRKQIAEDLANLYSVLEFGFGSCKICSVYYH